MSCQANHDLISAFVDGWLADKERGQLEDHLRCCSLCRERLEALRVLKHAIARLPGEEEPPAAIRAHIESLRYAEGRALRRPALGLAAMIALGVVAAVLLIREQRFGETIDTLVADHLRSSPSARPAQIESADPAAVAGFFTGEIPFQPVVPDITDATLVGARLCSINGHKTELIFYQQSGQPVSVFISDTRGVRPGCQQRAGTTVCGKRAHGLDLRVVASLPSPALQQILREVEQSVERRSSKW